MFTRNCPKCNKECQYKSKGAFVLAEKRKTNCKSCSTHFNKINEEVKKGIRENGFKNKQHNQKTKRQIANKRKLNNDKYTTPEYLQKLSEAFKGDKNPMFGISLYEVWVKKYGKEQANSLQQSLNKKRSFNVSGSKNGMFGKPAPLKSGNGWKGWFKGVYFRSFHELSYLVNYVDKYKLQMINAEKACYSIEYLDALGNIKNYFADYIIDNKYLIEIKPTRLHNTQNVLIKKEAAIEFCKNNKLIYKIIDPIKLSLKEIDFLIEKQELNFTAETQIKYKKYKNEKENCDHT